MAPAYEFKSDQVLGLRSVLPSLSEVTEDVLLGPGKWLVLSDIHIPYHDPDALEIAIEYGVRLGIENVLLNGDIIDCYQLSRFDRNPEAVGIADELRMLGLFFEELRKRFGGSIVWKMGNHEDRFERYLMAKAPELHGAPGLSLREMSSADEWDVATVQSRQKIKAGHLNILHGHEFGESTFSPVNPARGLFLRAKCSVLAGHNHQTSEHHENNVNGDSMACWSTGCLCDLRPSYRPFAFTKWNHGFATVEVEGDGRFTVGNHRIIEGVVR